MTSPQRLGHEMDETTRGLKVIITGGRYEGHKGAVEAIVYQKSWATLMSGPKATTCWTLRNR